MRPDAHALLAAYAADAVDDDERDDVQAHLASCSTCSDDLVALRETLADFAEQAWEVPPQSMRTAVIAAAAATPQERPVGFREIAQPSEIRRLPVQRRPPALLALAAGFAALTVLGAATAGVLAQRLSDARDDRDGTARVLAAGDGEVLRGEVTLPAGLDAVASPIEVVVVASQETDSAVFVAAGLPEAPDGMDWQTWYVDDTGARSAGLFDPDGGVKLLDGGIDGAGAIAVSLEPDGGSQAPTSDPVAVLTLT